MSAKARGFFERELELFLPSGAQAGDDWTEKMDGQTQALQQTEFIMQTRETLLQKGKSSWRIAMSPLSIMT